MHLPEDSLQIQTLAKYYKNGWPFPYLLLNGLFSGEALRTASWEIDAPDETWYDYNNPLEKKYAKDNLHGGYTEINKIIGYLQSKVFVAFLERVTGIKGLITDHTLRGGGIHQIKRGGKLDIHKDFDYHPQLRLKRRLNLILYLNSVWDPEWKGELEFWFGNSCELFTCEKKIAPKLGTAVLFSTEGNAYHGHPDPLSCPEKVTRKSIALYYYTSPIDEIPASSHSTIYMKRPGDPLDPELDALRSVRARGRIPTP